MQLNYKKFGERDQSLIILHGLFGSLDNWQTLAKKFGEHYSTYIIDQRNHGKSPHNDTFDYSSMAEDLKEFIKEHNIEKPHLLGHSMGGKTIMQFAMQYPELLNKMVVVDMAPKQYSPHHNEVIEALQSFDVEKVETRNDAEEMMARKIPEFGVRQFLLKNLDRVEDGKYRWKMNLPVIINSYDNILKEIIGGSFQSPTLFIRGGKSKYIGANDNELIHQLFPKAEIFTIENAGHWVHAEAPKELYDKVLDFLK